MAIDPVIDPNSRSVKLRAQIANPDGTPASGPVRQAACSTPAATTPTALLVPEQALMQDGEERFVYTVVDGKAKQGRGQDRRARARARCRCVEGLKAGDVVITAGQAKPMMHDGARRDAAAAAKARRRSGAAPAPRDAAAQAAHAAGRLTPWSCPTSPSAARSSRP